MDARRTTLYNLPPELAEHSQYEVLRELGRGGMGVVYLAKNKLMDRLEVLKVVNKALLDRPGSVERFLREIRSAAKLNHPNVVAAYSALQIGELLVFAMEYIEGEDLAALVKARGPLPVTHACHYVQQAAIGLQHAFEKGMVHRDIKPQNLILAREGKKHIVKVLDFGLAKATREKADDTALTGEGQMLGTPDFMAPEQTVDAARADIRADIYSLGCTLYFLLTGTPPFRGKSLGAVILAHQSTEARPLNLVRPEVSQELGAVVWKMMAKQPAQRYQTPAEVVQALAGAGKSAVKGTPPKSSPNVPAPAAEGLSDEEKRLLRAETIALSPQAAQATMLGPNATPGDTRNILSAKTILPVQARQARGGRKPPPAATGKSWLIGAAVAAVLLLGLLGLWVGRRVFTKKPKHDTIELENVPSRPPKKGNDLPQPVPAALGAGDYDLTGGYRFVHFGKDQTRVVLGWYGNNKQKHFLRVCDLATGRALTPPLEHDSIVTHASFSSDGKRVITASYDKTAQVWDANTGKKVTPPLQHEDKVRHASFSPDGQRVVSASDDKTARVWDAATGQARTPPLKHDGAVWHASFSPDGLRVVTASGDKTARLWDAATGKQVIPPLQHAGVVRHASFSPDGQRVVTVSMDKTARLWDVATGKEVAPPLKHEDWVYHASFSPDGQRVVTASMDKTARLWDAATGKELTLPLKHESSVVRASFSVDGKQVVTASMDKTARVWDAATGKPVTPPLWHGINVYNASFSPDGKRVATWGWNKSSSSKTAWLWDATTGEELKKVIIAPD